MSYKRKEWGSIKELEHSLVQSVFESGYQFLIDYVKTTKNIYDDLSENYGGCKGCQIIICLDATTDEEWEDYENNLKMYERGGPNAPERCHPLIHCFTCDSCKNKIKKNE